MMITRMTRRSLADRPNEWHRGSRKDPEQDGARRSTELEGIRWISGQYSEDG